MNMVLLLFVVRTSYLLVSFQSFQSAWSACGGWRRDDMTHDDRHNTNPPFTSSTKAWVCCWGVQVKLLVCSRQKKEEYLMHWFTLLFFTFILFTLLFVLELNYCLVISSSFSTASRAPFNLVNRSEYSICFLESFACICSLH